MADMTPQIGDTSIVIPITFDYNGGRGETKKWRIIASCIVIVLTLILTIGVSTNKDMELWLKFILDLVILYVGSIIIRFAIFREIRFSDIYETFKETDYSLNIKYFWQIFDVEQEYPYTCYFRNGKKGIFVKMVRSAVIGKSENTVYDHYEAVADGYNKAYSLKMDLVHIDYMEDIGSDGRLDDMMNELSQVEGENMRMLLSDMYNNISYDLSGSYAAFDVYLFITRNEEEEFIKNVTTVCQSMLGGNYITYKVMNKYELSSLCKDLFNFNEFSINEACDAIVESNGTGIEGITPIKLISADGKVTILNQTQQEKRLSNEIAERRRKEEEILRERKKKELREVRKKSRRNKNKPVNTKQEDEEIELY